MLKNIVQPRMPQVTT